MNARDAYLKMLAIQSEVYSPCCHAPMTWWSAEHLPAAITNAEYGRCGDCHSRVEADEFDWKEKTT